jgi:hypothetical protein
VHPKFPRSASSNSSQIFGRVPGKALVLLPPLQLQHLLRSLVLPPSLLLLHLLRSPVLPPSLLLQHLLHLQVLNSLVASAASKKEESTIVWSSN